MLGDGWGGGGGAIGPTSPIPHAASVCECNTQGLNSGPLKRHVSHPSVYSRANRVSFGHPGPRTEHLSRRLSRRGDHRPLPQYPEPGSSFLFFPLSRLEPSHRCPTSSLMTVCCPRMRWATNTKMIITAKRVRPGSRVAYSGWFSALTRRRRKGSPCHARHVAGAADAVIPLAPNGQQFRRSSADHSLVPPSIISADCATTNWS